MRFYPDCVPEFEHEPTTHRFSIEYINADFGEGIISLDVFRLGDIIFAFTGYLVDRVTEYSLTISEKQHIHDPYFAGKLMHACEPNAFLDINRRTCIARARILPGDIVTIDYEETEDKLFKVFTCKCAAVTCRGVIRGLRYR